MREESMRASSQMLGAGSLMPAWGAQRGRYRGLIFFFFCLLWACFVPICRYCSDVVCLVLYNAYIPILPLLSTLCFAHGGYFILYGRCSILDGIKHVHHSTSRPHLSHLKTHNGDHCFTPTLLPRTQAALLKTNHTGIEAGTAIGVKYCCVLQKTLCSECHSMQQKQVVDRTRRRQNKTKE